MTSQHCTVGAGAQGCHAPFGVRSIGVVPPGAVGVPAPPSRPRPAGEGATAGLLPATTPERPSPDPALVLNQRDVELLRHLAAGASTARTAAALSVTSNTVRTRLRRIQAKLAVGDRENAVRRAQEAGTV
jgi:DNA-binding CsgD family transcriptional regulator